MYIYIYIYILKYVYTYSKTYQLCTNKRFLDIVTVSDTYRKKQLTFLEAIWCFFAVPQICLAWYGTFWMGMAAACRCWLRWKLPRERCWASAVQFSRAGHLLKPWWIPQNHKNQESPRDVLQILNDLLLVKICQNCVMWGMWMLEAFIKCEPNSELWNALVKHIVLQLKEHSTFKFFCAWACIGKTEETEGVILVKCSLNVPDLSLKHLEPWVIGALGIMQLLHPTNKTLSCQHSLDIEFAFGFFFGQFWSHLNPHDSSWQHMVGIVTA